MYNILVFSEICFSNFLGFFLVFKFETLIMCFIFVVREP